MIKQADRVAIAPDISRLATNILCDLCKLLVHLMVKATQEASSRCTHMRTHLFIQHSNIFNCGFYLALRLVVGSTAFIIIFMQVKVTNRKMKHQIFMTYTAQLTCILKNFGEGVKSPP